MRFLLPAFLVLLMSTWESASALPRFASRTGWKCQSCHVNPAGGGMRQANGVRYGREELPVPTWADEFEMEDFTTQLSDVVSVGADVRTLFYYTMESEENRSDHNEFFQMQGDIYINLKLAKKVNIYVDKGLRSGFEIFGNLRVLPANGFVKVGKFIPQFGTRLDDHTSYIRSETGLSPETGAPTLTGGEIGFMPGPVTIVGGVYNANDAFMAGSEKSVLGRAEGIFALSEDVNLGIGGNILYTEMMQGRENYLGGFGSFSVSDFTLLGEANLLKRNVSGVKSDGLVVYGEANFMVVQGLDLKVIYDFYDPNIDVKEGSDTRYGFGFEFFPISGVEVRPLYRIVEEESRDTKYDQLLLLLHLYL